MNRDRRMLRLLVGATLFAHASILAQTKPNETSSGTVKQTILMDAAGTKDLSPEAELIAEDAGLEPRNYWLHLPVGDDGKTPLPLVIVLHPRGGTGPRMERITGWSIKADREKFIAVYPDAEGNPRTWNAGFLSGLNKDDDAKFLTALLDQIPKKRAVDPKRIYIVGHGSGAMMAYWAGSTLADRIAGIGVVSGAVGVRRDNGEVRTIPALAHPISVIAFHGQHNSVVPYKGGFSQHSRRRFLSIVDAKNFWSTANVCNPEAEFEGVVMTRSPSGGLPSQAEAKADIFDTEAPQRVKVFRETYSVCADGVEVVFYGIVQGNHKWPGGRELLYRSEMTPREIKATDTMWEFFTKHPKP